MPCIHTGYIIIILLNSYWFKLFSYLLLSFFIVNFLILLNNYITCIFSNLLYHHTEARISFGRIFNTSLDDKTVTTTNTTANKSTKGVLIPETLEEAVAGVKEIMEDKVFGASGNHIVVDACSPPI